MDTLKIGDTVRIPVSMVDRSRSTARNLIGIVMQEPKNGLDYVTLTLANCIFQGAFKVGTRSGVINVLLHRDQLEKADVSNFLIVADIPDCEISVREAARSEAPGGGQGFLRCGCTGKCQTNACKCKKNNAVCNSRCHPGRSCLNKD